MRRAELGSMSHLAARFVSSLLAGGPSSQDEQWARGWLLPGEDELWGRMSAPDRRHAVEVARVVTAELKGAPREVVAAALLHDVGKVEAGIGTWARTAATLAALAVGRDRVVAWAGRCGGRRWGKGLVSRLGHYLEHDRIGARLLEAAGSHELTAAWAREHHLPPGRSTLPDGTAALLKAADGD